MTAVRSLIFILWLYLSMVLFAVGLSPALLMPHRVAVGVIKLWSKFVLFGLRWIAGVKVEVRGLEHRPTGPALIAAKHQGMLDVIAPFAFLDDACFVMKKELMPLPFFGWFAWKTKMIAVDRSAHSKALKDMVRQARSMIRLTFSSFSPSRKYAPWATRLARTLSAMTASVTMDCSEAQTVPLSKVLLAKILVTASSMSALRSM